MEAAQIPTNPTTIPGKKTVFVLAIDGGGIRGTIPCRMVQEIEHLTKKHAAELFDFIAGTSIGGIITLGLTVPDEKKKPKLSADKIMEMFMIHGQEIFKQDPLKFLSSGQGLTDEKYESKGLENTLNEYYGSDSLLSESLIPTVATAFEIVKSQAYHFRSYDTAHDFKRVFCGRCTSAWPCLFELAQGTNTKQESFVMVDGGVVMVNPALYAYDEARKVYPDAEKIVVVSLGTGVYKANLKASEAKDWGAIKWFGPLLDIMNNSQIDTADAQMRSKLDNEHYFRLQVQLPENLYSIEDGSVENVTNLVKKTEEFIVNNKAQFDHIAEVLLAPRK